MRQSRPTSAIGVHHLATSGYTATVLAGAFSTEAKEWLEVCPKEPGGA